MQRTMEFEHQTLPFSRMAMPMAEKSFWKDIIASFVIVEQFIPFRSISYPEKLLNTPMWRISFVSTKPGSTAFTVTPVPLNLLANSLANITFANLLWLYAAAGSYCFSLLISVILMWPFRCAELATTTTLLGADFCVVKCQEITEQSACVWILI